MARTIPVPGKAAHRELLPPCLAACSADQAAVLLPFCQCGWDITEVDS
ncbi:hypothetical protein ACIGPN_36010 [Streptomyces afghaniensis]